MAVAGLGLQSTVDGRIGLRGLSEDASVTGLGRCSFIYIYILSPECNVNDGVTQHHAYVLYRWQYILS
jgi:hypothetical protein